MDTIKITVEELKNTCFVAMPFHDLFQIEYEEVIKPAIEELKVECIRGDEIYSTQRIMDDIWKSIRSCRFVIAELTHKNPNVMYELGLAHAIGKPIIIITRNEDDVPFDLKDLRYLYYDISNPFWGNNLKIGLQELIRKIIDNPEIGKYLDGILTKHNKEFKVKKTRNNKKSNIANKAISIEGNWKGEFNSKYLHKINIHLDQNNEEIIGSAVISYIKNDKLTVVQEILKGYIKGIEVNLKGVNYTYIERGNGTNYLLDTFNLTLNAERNALIGIMESSKSKDINMKLERIKE